MAINKIKTGSIQDGTVTTDDIQDGAITNAKVNACAAVAQSKVSGLATSISNLCSSISSVSSSIGQQANNIGLLGFKMAVNDGLTVFNLVDGVVDEFNDESGTDEAEGSNDHYCATTDFYTNQSGTGNFSAGFTTTAVTEADTSTAQTAPNTCQNGTTESNSGEFTVPTGMTSANLYIWGAGGGARDVSNCAYGGAGGFATGTFAVTGGQTLYIATGFGGQTASEPSTNGVFFGGGGGRGEASSDHSSGGGGMSGVFTTGLGVNSDPGSAPRVVMIAGGGGGGGHGAGGPDNFGGAAGGTIGNAGGQTTEQTNADGPSKGGGGGDQEQGGQGGTHPQGNGTGQTGSFLKGGDSVGSPHPHGGGAGGGGYFGGGASGNGTGVVGAGGGGSSFIGHPQITSGSTEEGPGSGSDNSESGGSGSPLYPTATSSVTQAGDGAGSNFGEGNSGFVLITGTAPEVGQPGGGTSTIVSNAFASGTVATTSRIVVFQENVDTPTLNTDIIASVSRDAGVTFTAATLADSGYVTGSSGQRILTGQADISGQPSGQSMRWKLALANNTVKIHGVSLQWS
jgi:hypothetical protein